MTDTGIDVVTGAFSYSGRALATELERRGRRLRTLTNHPQRKPAGSQIETFPLDFDPITLRAALTGVDTLYSNYWVRFPHGDITFDTAVANAATLFRAAAEAGVRRIVQVSITHADPTSRYPYFSGKGRLERHLTECGVGYAIARPAILFGGDGVLVNNIAWLLRRIPVMGIGGDGSYRIRPIHIDDLAVLLADLGVGQGNQVVDAVGPQSLPFREMVGVIKAAVGSRSLLMPLPGWSMPAVGALLGLVLRDKLLTGEEYQAMADGLADSDASATGSIVFADWVAAHGDELGRRYANEITRHYQLG